MGFRVGIILIRVVSAIVVFVQAEYRNDTSGQCVQMTEVIENITKMLDASNFGCICQEGKSVLGSSECVDNLKSMPQYKKLTLITIGRTCASRELREAFSKINLRQASSVLVSIGGHCVQTFLDEWVVFTDHVSRDIIEKHTKRIINIAFVTYKSHGCNEVQSVIWSNLQPTLVQSTWPLQSLDDLFPAKKFGLNGVQLRVAVMEWCPYLIKSSDAGCESYSGSYMDVLEMMATSMNFSFTCVEPPDGEWGVRHPNGSWSGLAGLMQRREGDMVATAFTETFLRSQVMDFTSLCVFSDYKAFSYKKPSSRRANLAAFILPFDRIVWLCGVIVVLLVHLVPARVEYSPLHSGARWSRWLLFNSGNLTACLAVSNLNTPFTTFADLTQQNEYQMGMIGGSVTESLFGEGELEPYRTIGRSNYAAEVTDPSVLSRDVAAHLKRVSGGGYIYIGYLFIESAFEDCSVTTQHSNEQYPLRYKFAFQKNSALKSSADKVVQRLHENGIFAKLKMKYNLQKKWACPSNIAPEAKQLDLEYFTGIAFMIASLLLAATLVLLLEKCCFSDEEPSKQSMIK
ncbi:hypothetical protein CAPTEDRAFT_189588 [Capitella teleta]|uniref:Ionotropic glutamate receptor L-glutamate and glycine-binding domain-containing protein n=1 Tax=Capitella teleta TaxID=283909 RepID=R7VJE2_CAPTE|nr:hypothetical protein CAPTEDRAFT_189588 [Capitella teleta]|eukprot:ELU16476.1 hypothetical protein CAPTEDRAFT_189588 [Capitella teleta]